MFLISLIGHAQTLTVLHAFNGTDGNYPSAPLLRDSIGNLYGTTPYGGAAADGNIFEIEHTGRFKVLYEFSGSDGMWPSSGLIRDSSGNLYGETEMGGANNAGVVFKLDSAGSETILHSFGSTASDGMWPSGGLARDVAGNFYGSTQTGTDSAGTIFKFDSAGNETILYSFTVVGGGSSPTGALALVRNHLYGTTSSGGSSVLGTLFVVNTNGGGKTLLNFQGTAGEFPFSGVLAAGQSLYGTTQFGGDLTCNAVSSGCGTIYKVDTQGHETVLYRFLGVPDGDDAVPGLVADKNGSLYGATIYGGTGPCQPTPAVGCGTLFKIDSSGNETVLYNFAGGSDGNYPSATLVRDAQGNLYGSTTQGGSSACNGSGCGVIFKLTP